MEDLKLSSLMDRHIVSVSPTTSVKSTLKLIADSGVYTLPVLEDGKLVGIVTEEALKGKAESSIVDSFMEKPLFLESQDGIEHAIQYMLRRNITRVAVVDSAIDMKCIGIVSSTELLKAKKKIK